MPMVELDEIKMNLGLETDPSADDALLADLQLQAESFIEGYCGRSFSAGPHTEYFPARSTVVLVRNFPIISLTSLKFDPAGVFGAETILPPERYTVSPSRGLVQAVGGRWGGGGESALQVIYTTASSVPDAVRRAAAELVGHWFRQAKTHVALGQINQLAQVVSGQENRYPWGTAGGFRIPAGVIAVLAAHRVPAI